MNADQLAAVDQGSGMVNQVIEQVSRMQAIVNGAQARRTFRMPVAHVMPGALGMGDIGGVHDGWGVMKIQ
jgi:hypothetical protein